MEKYIFIGKLKRALYWSFSQKEIREIAADYEGFFAQGKEDGKTEQEICAELGSPAEIAHDLAAEFHKRRPSVNLIVRILLAVSILIFGVFRSYYNWYDSFYIVVFAVVLWFALGGTLTDTPPVSYADGKSYTRRILFCHGALFAIAAMFFAFCCFCNFVLLNETYDLSKMPDFFANFTYKLLQTPSLLGPYIEAIINSLYAASFLILVWSLYCFYRRSPQYFTVTCHSLGVIAYITSIYYIIKQLDIFTYFFSGVLKCFFIYGSSLVLTALFALFIRTLIRRAR